MENNEEINKIIENLWEDIDDIKVIIKILNNKVESANYELYELQQRIKKETTAQ